MVLLAKVLKTIYDNEKTNQTEKTMKFQAKMKRGEKVNLKAASGEEEAAKTLLIILSVIVIIYLIISSMAMYFSWKHNTKIGWGTSYKVMFAFFAFLFPFEYISIYLTYKSDFLKYMERTNSEFVEPVVPNVSISP